MGMAAGVFASAIDISILITTGMRDVVTTWANELYGAGLLYHFIILLYPLMLLPLLLRSITKSTTHHYIDGLVAGILITAGHVLYTIGIVWGAGITTIGFLMILIIIRSSWSEWEKSENVREEALSHTKRRKGGEWA